MKANYEADANRVRIELDSATRADEFVAALERELGFMVAIPDSLALHHAVTVAITAGEISFDFEARVAQAFQKGDERTVAFLVDDPAEATRRLARAVRTAAPEPDDAAAMGEVRGASPIHRIKQMNPKQRSLLALKAGRTERQILLRDNVPLVLQNLLNNPHLDAEEVLQIARSSHAVAPILQRIAGDSRWNANQEIITAVVRNPRTPSLVASRHLPALRTQDLRMMAKLSSGVREVLRKAALREYMRRTGQRI